jgi:hypothetical protein
VKTKRFLLGLLSMFLLAAGFTRAAESLDPLAVSTPARATVEGLAAASCSVPCGAECDIAR